MKDYFTALRTHVNAHPPDLGDVDSVLSLLYEAYCDINPMEDAEIKAGFAELYRLMNGMTIREMDQILYPVCTLCRDHERSGFIHGVQVGIRLLEELG